MSYLRDQIKTLKQEAEQRCLATTSPVPPIKQQLANLIASQPVIALNRPWLMHDFVSRLQGKYRRHPHPQEVGSALRELGWQRIRLWKNGDGCRLWFPPNYQE